MKKRILGVFVSILVITLFATLVMAKGPTNAKPVKLHGNAKLAIAAWHQAGDQWLVAYASELMVNLPGPGEPVREMALRIYLVQWDGVWGHPATVRNFWKAELDPNEFVWNFGNCRVTAEVEAAPGVNVIIMVEWDTLPPTTTGSNILLPVITGFVSFDEASWRFGTATLTEVEPDGSVDVDTNGLAMVAGGVLTL